MLWPLKMIKRLRLIREAERLETEARKLRRSIADNLASTGTAEGLLLGVAGLVGLGVAQFTARPAHREAYRAAYRAFSEPWDTTKADQLTARATDLRREAGEL